MIQDIRWVYHSFRNESAPPQGSIHVNPGMAGVQLYMKLQVKIDGEWCDVPMCGFEEKEKKTQPRIDP